MIITDIKRQKNGRFAVYADGEYVMSADDYTLSQAGIVRGCKTTRGELLKLAAASDEQKAVDRAMTILTYRDHSKEELRRKLARTAGEDAAEKAAQRMEDLGLVNDESYAEKLARELLFRRLMGADRALFEMTRRGLDRDTASEAIDRIDTDPQERIERFVEKKYPQGLSDEKDFRRAQAALARNGYRWDDIHEVLRRLRE